jgi:hypothetical protein
MYREISDLGLFEQTLDLRARSVQKRPRSDITLCRPRARLIIIIIIIIIIKPSLYTVTNQPYYLSVFTKIIKVVFH